MREGWSICPALRLLNYKSPLSSAEFFDECYLRVTEDDELADIYIRLGLKMWGRVGTNDLFDKAYVEIIDFAFKNLTDMQTIQLKNNLESIQPLPAFLIIFSRHENFWDVCFDCYS